MTMPIALRTRVPSALLLLSLSSAAQQNPAPLSPFVKHELLVEAGFTPVEAIRIATLNGARFMGKDGVVGSIAVGKAADIVVLGGNPAEKIDNMEKVELVFKDGVGYDPDALIQSVRGLVGLR
jgi:imidazolonepropionase-like amidohydrolase